MEIHYRNDYTPPASQIIKLYENSGLSRPTHDADRIERMYRNSNVIISAWDKDDLVGVSRSITDWAWSCYLADLAVHSDYKKAGIGKKLIEWTKAKVGEETMILLLSVPDAMMYYPRVGFAAVDNGFILPRTK